MAPIQQMVNIFCAILLGPWYGTGFTLSSAIATNLAKGYELKESIQRSKDYLSNALADGLDLGVGAGPMNHAFKGHEAFSN